MQHSIVTRHAAWPARYVHPGPRVRERHLGLRGRHTFTAATAHRTVLHNPPVGPLTALRAPWRALVVAPARPARQGRPRPASAISWTSSDRGGGPRRQSLAPAWRA
jgi:hypothetical protein